VLNERSIIFSHQIFDLKHLDRERIIKIIWFRIRDELNGAFFFCVSKFKRSRLEKITSAQKFTSRVFVSQAKCDNWNFLFLTSFWNLRECLFAFVSLGAYSVVRPWIFNFDVFWCCNCSSWLFLMQKICTKFQRFQFEKFIISTLDNSKDNFWFVSMSVNPLFF